MSSSMATSGVVEMAETSVDAVVDVVVLDEVLVVDVDAEPPEVVVLSAALDVSVVEAGAVVVPADELSEEVEDGADVGAGV
jgi:hypothetical protein